jgi:hypothetical protein
MDDRPPPIDPTLVHRFVAVAHADLTAVEDLLAAEPRLVNAAWDWGGGDWETGLGAAAHMGRPDIAAALLARGARLDLYAAAMLGRLDVVRAVLEAFPEQADVPGPHGIPLAAHAQAGGDAALGVLEYLRQRVPG